MAFNTQEAKTLKRKKSEPSSQWCSAPNCTNDRYKSRGLSFFRFPREEERCQQWVKNARRLDLQGKSAEVLYRSNVLCAQHFEEDQFRNFRKNRLKPLTAVPTLFTFNEESNPPALLTVEIPDTAAPDNCGLVQDCNVDRLNNRQVDHLPDTTLHSAITMKAVRFTDSSADSLYIGEAPLPEPRENEVRIHVIATAINRADTLQRRGGYAPPPGASDVLGLEAAGLVDKLGPGCPPSITVGQRVMALLAGGGNAQYVTCPYQQLIPVPARLSWDEAAAIPEVWLTAFQLLHTVGNLRAEDTVLIHAGGSGVGTAAVQLVKLAGAAAIVSAGSQEKIDLAVSLGAVTGVNYKQGNVGNKVLDLTGGKGVNLILDCVGASMFEENVKAIATDGRWVFYGALGGTQLSLNMLPLLQKRIALTGSTLRSRSNEYKASLVAKFTSYAVPLFENGVLRPIISSVLPWTKIAEAHQIMEANQNLGKIVLRVSEADFEVKEESVAVQEDGTKEESVYLDKDVEVKEESVDVQEGVEVKEEL